MVDRQDPATRRGATIGWYRRFRESDGGLFVVLLTAYFFVTAIPAGVVMMSYVYNDPTELADRFAARLDLTGSVKAMLDSVLAGASGHQLGATLIAVFDVLPLENGPRAAPKRDRTPHVAAPTQAAYRKAAAGVIVTATVGVVVLGAIVMRLIDDEEFRASG